MRRKTLTTAAVGAFNARAKEMAATTEIRHDRRETEPTRRAPRSVERPPERPEAPPRARGHDQVEDGAFVTGGGEVIVDIERSGSAYENQIYWSADGSETWNLLGVDDEVASVNLGRFAAGTRITFAIDNGQGDRFTSDADGVDGLQHARFDQDGNTTRVGFEDLLGGGDLDFDDAVVSVRTRGVGRPHPLPDDPPALGPPDLAPDDPPDVAPDDPPDFAPDDPPDVAPDDPPDFAPDDPPALGPPDVAPDFPPGLAPDEPPVEDLLPGLPVAPDVREPDEGPGRHRGRDPTIEHGGRGGRGGHGGGYHLGEYLDMLLPEPTKRPHWVEPPDEGVEAHEHIDIER